MKDLKTKITAVSLFASLIFGNFSVQITAQELEDSNHTTGQLHGKIIVPAGSNLSSIMIQVVGANQHDTFTYYTVPNSDGSFNFDGILPPGSVVQLYIWDGSGILNSTTMSAYVTQKHSQAVGTYEIVMYDNEYTQNLAQFYKTTQDLTNTGICGSVGRFRPANGPKLKIFVYDRYLKHDSPLMTQELDDRDRFCFFNLSSLSGSDMYDFVLMSEDEQKTFTYYLPSTTFLHGAFLDTNASLYRPIKPYIWKDDFTIANNKKTQWTKLDTLNLSTSDDYAFVSYDETKQDENLFYFPLTNELLEVSYFLNGETAERFFMLIPRTKLFRDVKINRLSNGISDQIYVDYENPLPLKLTTESDLIKINSNYYAQTWNEKLGSVFININLSQFDMTNSKDLKLTIRNIFGQDVGVFEELITNTPQRMLGFFLNLLPGRYQLFLSNTAGDLLWTYEIRSYPNKVQVVTNDWDQAHIDPTEYELFKNYAKIRMEHNYYAQNELDIFFEEKYVPETSLQKKEQVYIQNNSFFKHDIEKLCLREKTKGLLEHLESFNTH